MSRNRSNPEREAEEIIASMARMAGKHRHIRWYTVKRHTTKDACRMVYGPWIGIDGDLALEHGGGWDSLVDVVGFLRYCLEQRNANYLLDYSLEKDADTVILPGGDCVVVFEGFGGVEGRWLKQGLLGALARPQRAGAMIMLLENRIISGEGGA